jgi:hypothetical protein
VNSEISANGEFVWLLSEQLNTPKNKRGEGKIYRIDLKTFQQVSFPVNLTKTFEFTSKISEMGRFDFNLIYDSLGQYVYISPNFLKASEKEFQKIDFTPPVNQMFISFTGNLAEVMLYDLDKREYNFFNIENGTKTRSLQIPINRIPNLPPPNYRLGKAAIWSKNRKIGIFTDPTNINGALILIEKKGILIPIELDFTSVEIQERGFSENEVILSGLKKSGNLISPYATYVLNSDTGDFRKLKTNFAVYGIGLKNNEYIVKSEYERGHEYLLINDEGDYNVPSKTINLKLPEFWIGADNKKAYSTIPRANYILNKEYEEKSVYMFNLETGAKHLIGKPFKDTHCILDTNSLGNIAIAKCGDVVQVYWLNQNFESEVKSREFVLPK